MIKFDNVSMHFYTDKTVKAINNFSFVFSDKGFYSIVGRSGSGKSTILNLISGLLKPTEGKIELLSFDLHKISQSEFEYIRQNYIGFVYQDYILFEHLTVYENLSIALDLKGDENKEKIHEVLNDLDIEHLINTQVAKLSGGEKQRVSIARALVKDVKILQADEPTGSLDDTNAVAVYEILKKVSKDRLVVMVTHDQINASKYSDCVINISQGEISNIDDCKVRKGKDDLQNHNIGPSHAITLKQSMLYSNVLFKKRFKRVLFTTIFHSVKYFV